MTVRPVKVHQTIISVHRHTDTLRDTHSEPLNEMYTYSIMLR